MSEVIVRYSDNGYGNVSGEMVGELVRCKECRWQTKDQYDEPYCGLHSIGIYADDYCSYGEREGD